MSTVAISEALLRDMRVTDEEIVAELMDGRTISVPLAWSWRLSEATPEQRANVHIIGNGQGAHWPDIDEDISARGMLVGIPAPRPSSAVWSVASPGIGEAGHVVVDRALKYRSVNVRTSSSEVQTAHSKAAASEAISTLSSKSTGKSSKSAAGSALSQTKGPSKTTSSKTATAASKTLRDGRASAGSKSASGSALSQKHGTKGGKK